MVGMASRWGGWTAGAAATAAGLYAVLQVHAAGQSLLALTLLVLLALALWAYTSARSHALRYLFPGVAAAVVFVIFPMLYTVGIGFTNYSSTNMLSHDAARAALLGQAVPVPGMAHGFTVHRAGPGYRLRLLHADGTAWHTPPLVLPAGDPASAPATASANTAQPLQAGAAQDLGAPLPLRDLVPLLPALRALRLSLPGGEVLSLISLREFAQLRPLYEAQGDGTLKDSSTGALYRADDNTGYYTASSGATLLPGYRVGVGLQHYTTLFGQAKFREPFVGVFVWTVTFAALSVAGAAALGLLLAVLLNWAPLQGKAAYRLVLFLPYAVPGFISILVFKGLFNQNLGEVNFILHGLFGIRPAWFSDPLLAKLMLLFVNVWLGFPYMMVLCSGLIKSIPADLYEASAVAGAGPWANFWHITRPLILKPLAPLLISAFAFNFNNFVLISLLTGGRPDRLDTTLPAGTTDILVSYTGRIAFQDSGQQFGLASAISTVIFFIVAAITLLQLRFMRQADSSKR